MKNGKDGGHLAATMIAALEMDKRDLLRIIGFLPYTSIVCETKAQELVIYGFKDDEQYLFNQLQRTMVEMALKEKEHMMGVESYIGGKMIKPHSDNKIVFLVIFEGKLEFFGFKDGNLWRGQGIGGDWIN